jgi:hypothetical protein
MYLPLTQEEEDERYKVFNTKEVEILNNTVTILDSKYVAPCHSI